MKKIQKEAEVALRKTQEEIKRYADRGRKETEKWKRGDWVLLSTKDLVFKKRPSKKLIERYVGPYMIEEVVSLNAVKLRLPSSMRIHPVVNVSWIVHYKEQVNVMGIRTLTILFFFFFSFILFLILLFFFLYFIFLKRQ